MLPLTVPEVRRLLLALAEPPERFSRRLAWSDFRRHHQAVAKRAHAARRARQQPPNPTPPTIVQLLPSLACALSDSQWQRVVPLLPPHHAARGRPMLDHRRIVGGMLWVARTGRSWRELPAEFGPWQTAYSRYRRWSGEGIWQRILATLQQTDPLG